MNINIMQFHDIIHRESVLYRYLRNIHWIKLSLESPDVKVFIVDDAKFTFEKVNNYCTLKFKIESYEGYINTGIVYTPLNAIVSLIMSLNFGISPSEQLDDLQVDTRYFQHLRKDTIITSYIRERIEYKDYIYWLEQGNKPRITVFRTCDITDIHEDVIYLRINIDIDHPECNCTDERDLLELFPNLLFLEMVDSHEFNIDLSRLKAYVIGELRSEILPSEAFYNYTFTDWTAKRA